MNISFSPPDITNAEIQAVINVLQSGWITTGPKTKEIEKKIAADSDCHKLIEQYTSLKHLTREMVEILIDYIYVGKRIPGTKDVPIEIHWNF